MSSRASSQPGLRFDSWGFILQYFKIAPYPVKTLLFVISRSVAKYIAATVHDVNLLGFSSPRRNARGENFHLEEQNKHKLWGLVIPVQVLTSDAFWK